MEPGNPQEHHLPLFGGSAINKIDSQRRIAVPAFWRDENPSGRYVVMPAREATLQLYTEEAYETLYRDKLDHMDPNDPDLQKKRRILFSLTFRITCDKQGRLQLPEKLCTYAQFKDEIAFIGAGNYGQMMDGSRWRAEEEEGLSTGDSFLDILS